MASDETLTSPDAEIAPDTEAPGGDKPGGAGDDKPAVGRPNRQTERRREILDASIRLIEGHDLATLRLTDIADALGLTANAVRYYYKDMDTLLSHLALRSDQRFYDERKALVERTPSSAEQLAVMIAGGLPTDAEDAEWRAIWRAILAAGFELDRRSDVQGIYHRQVGLYAEVLTRGVRSGAFTLVGESTDIAMTLMAMEDYFGYRIVARDPQIDRPTGLRLMRGYATTVTGANLPPTD